MITDRLSKESLSRDGSTLKEAARYLKNPGIISIGGGLPTSEYFPFDELSIKVPSIGHFSEQQTHENGQVITAGKHDLVDGSSLFDITTAFNYGQGAGAPQLLRFVVEHTELIHHPPYADWHCTLSVGSTSALDMAFRMFCERGDYLMTEEYTFSSALDAARQMGLSLVGLDLDEQGIIPSSLDHLLSTWDAKVRGGRKPFLLYTVPSGQNPTGATQSLRRRKDLYKLAQRHDLYILEDEPYYFLQMAPYDHSSSAPSTPLQPSTRESFLSSLVPSLLSLDIDGRVMRLDSFSKVIAPGTRIGWVTASAQIADRYAKHADVSTQCPSGISQLVLYKLLDEHWGHAGYLDWLMHLRTEYTRRRDCILGACDDFLPTDVISWIVPAAGMFLWMRVDWERHPRAEEMSISELEERIFQAAVAKGTLVMKGSFFEAEPKKMDQSNGAKGQGMFFRATYAAAPSDMIREAVRRLGLALREEFALADQDVHVPNGSHVNGNGHGEPKA